MIDVAPYLLYQAYDDEYLVNSGLSLFNEFSGQATLTVVDQLVTPIGFVITSELGTGVIVGTGADVNITPIGFVISAQMAEALPEFDTTEYPDGFGISIQLGTPDIANHYNENIVGFSALGLTLGTPAINTGQGDTNITPIGFAITSALGTVQVDVPSGIGSTTGIKGRAGYRPKIRRDR